MEVKPTIQPGDLLHWHYNKLEWCGLVLEVEDDKLCLLETEEFMEVTNNDFDSWPAVNIILETLGGKRILLKYL